MFCVCCYLYKYLFKKYIFILEYWEEVFKLIGDNCLDSIFRVQQELKNMLNNPEGQTQVAGDFKYIFFFNLLYS